MEEKCKRSVNKSYNSFLIINYEIEYLQTNLLLERSFIRDNNYI